MRVVYMGHQPIACEGLKYLIQKGIDVVVVVASPRNQPVHWEPGLIDAAEQYGIPTASDEDLYHHIKEGNTKGQKFDLTNIDLVISFLFWKRIRKPLIELPRIGCINFHSAPLPEFRGFAPYSFGIYENVPYWGVTAHVIDESFDTGDIIKIKKFDINPEQETAFSLQQKSHRFLLELFYEVIDEALENGQLQRTPQGRGRHATKKDFEKLRKIRPHDTPEEIERKIRAFWCPPFAGASIEMKGKEYTLINERLLQEIGNKYREAPRKDS